MKYLKFIFSIKSYLLWPATEAATHTHNERLKVSLPHLSSWSHRAPLILQLNKGIKKRGPPGWIKKSTISKNPKLLKKQTTERHWEKRKIANWGREKRIKPPSKNLGG